MHLSDEHLFRVSLRSLRSVRDFLLLLAVMFVGSVVRGEVPSQLMGTRFLTFNTIVRVNQIEVARDISQGAKQGGIAPIPDGIMDLEIGARNRQALRHSQNRGDPDSPRNEEALLRACIERKTVWRQACGQ